MSHVRDHVVAALSDELARRAAAHTLRVCVDGPDAAGKTTLADELADRLGRHRPVIRLSIDRFHLPQAIRHQRGPLSAEGYYHDSFDYETVAEAVLRPLGPGGDGRYLPAVFDYRTERASHAARQQAPPGAVLLFDGVFMLRPKLRDFWDMSIYLHVDPEVTLHRARLRDLELFGSVEAVEQRYRRRYLPGQELYRADAHPIGTATVVLNTNDPLQPLVVRWP
ncbi:uridine kinase [Allorhizocola rhizosphaerae]|uniref:uridine kinase n=1 Tax=Allorhizocola rhizosphaerae TaxID=1872709 RepID=UPI000E3C5655|nr:uridine kinase [Allorhizocola rhizosphaerae]